MLAELDVAVYLKSNDDLDQIAGRVFGALRSESHAASSEEWGGSHYEASGLGFRAVLYPNDGNMLDPEFEDYRYTLEIMSQFWCVELDTLDLEAPLSEYYSRELAFELNVETATEILIETTEEAEVFEIRAFRRNPQYRLDQAPTVPKVFVIEQREVERPFEEEEEADWDEDTDEDTDEMADEELAVEEDGR